MDRTVDAQAHRHRGDHGRSHVHFEAQPSHGAEYDDNREHVRNQRDQRQHDAPKSDRHHDADADRGDGEAGPLVAQHARDQIGQQHIEAGDLRGLTALRGREVLFGHARDLGDQLGLLGRGLLFAGPQHDAQVVGAARVGVFRAQRLHEIRHGGRHAPRLQLGGNAIHERIDAGRFDAVDQAQDFGQPDRLLSRVVANRDGAQCLLKSPYTIHKGIIQLRRRGDHHIPHSGTAQVFFDERVRFDDRRAATEVSW